MMYEFVCRFREESSHILWFPKGESFVFFLCFFIKFGNDLKVVGKTWLGGNCGRIWDRRRGVDQLW